MGSFNIRGCCGKNYEDGSTFITPPLPDEIIKAALAQNKENPSPDSGAKAAFEKKLRDSLGNKKQTG